MQYHEAANFLFGLNRFSISPGTEAVEDLLDHLGNPEADLAFVQVAGSNGKGSTARMTESVLREAGLSVGLYVSPHLEDLSERVRVDGHPVSDDAIAEFVAETKPWLVDRAADGDPLTFFEVVTAMGVWWFARRDVDVAVLEVGLGGEYDATSAVDPLATAVTTVSLEHTAVLGDTVEEIARTKARIADRGAPMVTACGGEALSVVREVVADAGGDLTTVAGPGVDDPDPDPDVTAAYRGRASTDGDRSSPTDSAVALSGPDWAYDARIPLVGDHQATNAGVAAALAHATAEALDADVEVTDEAALAGLARAYWPGRFEVLGTDPLVVLDSAHNPAACATLADTLAEYEYDDLHVAFAAMHDKDHGGMVENLPTPDSVVTCRPDLQRAEDPEVLAVAFENGGVEDVTAGDSVADAFATVRERAGPDDCALLAGSLFAVAEARTTYTRTFVPKRAADVEDAETLLADADVTPARIRTTRESVVHRTVKTRLRSRQAERVRGEFLAVGGECAVSGVTTGGELVDVVLSGTLSQFRRLLDVLEDAEDGLPRVSEPLRRRFGFDRERPTHGYPWEDGTAVMGVLNVTPDSFHDGGRHEALEDAVAGARRMIDAGAEIIDVGGESTRPGAEAVPLQAELDRVVPAVESLQEIPEIDAGDVVVSVDTRKPAVAEAALEAGADIVNDVTGVEDPRMREVIADAGCPVVVMHSVDAPVDPERDVAYEDVVEDVIRDLQERILRAETAGIAREKVIIDPGIGFGKSAAESFDLLGRVDEFAALGCPVLVGHSYKSLFGGIGYEPEDREYTTVAGTAVAVERGADIVRVHDVAENRAAVDVVEAATDPDRLE